MRFCVPILNYCLSHYLLPQFWEDRNPPVQHRILVISEFTQQDGGKKRTAKCLSATNVTGLLLASFVGNSLNIDVFCSSTKRSV